MKKMFWLFIIVAIFSGCVVQSLNRPYTNDTVVNMESLNGYWKPIKLLGDAYPSKNNPWEIQNGLMITYDKKNNSSKLKTVFFKIKNNTYLTTFPDEPKKYNLFWTINVRPVYLICKIEVTNEKLMIIPMNYKYIAKAIENKTLQLPYQIGDDKSLLITASSKEWVQFLEKHSDNKELFWHEISIILTKEKS